MTRTQPDYVMDTEGKTAAEPAEPEEPQIPMDTSFVSPNDFFTFERPLDVFYIPEMNKKLYIRANVTAREVDAYRQSLFTGKGQNITINQRDSRAKLAVLGIANADGSRMFQDSDVRRISLMWASIILERVADRVKKLNGITDEDMGSDDEAKNG